MRALGYSTCRVISAWHHGVAHRWGARQRLGMRTYQPMGNGYRLMAGMALAMCTAPLWAAHPLQTDDTGTQGTSHWQLEVNTDRTRARADAGTDTSQQANATLTYGVTDTVDVFLNQPYSWLRPSTGERSRGINDSSLGLKWRLADNGAGWTVGVKPSISLPTASTRAGLGNGRSTTSLEVLSSLQSAHWDWLLNLGATSNNNTTGNRRALWNASTALLYNPNSHWTLAAELTTNRNPDPSGPASLRTALLAAIYHWGDNCDLDLGVRRNWQATAAATTLSLGFTQRW